MSIELETLADRIANEEGVDPSYVRAIITQESRWNPKAQSPKKAKGLMQLMDDTAAELGVTDPFDPEQNVRGGTRYFKKLLDRYKGDKDKALVAYNWGMGNLDKYGMEKAPEATKNYLKKVTANLYDDPIVEDSKKEAYDDPIVNDYEDPIVEEPSWRQVAGQATASAIGALGRGTTALAAGAVGLVNEEASDAMFAAGDKFGETMNNFVLSPEQMKNSPLWKQITGGAAGGSPIGLAPLALGPVGVPIATAIAVIQAVPMAMDAIKNGESVETAYKIALAQGGANAASIAIPGMAQTIPGMLGKAVVTGPGFGAAADYISNIASTEKTTKDMFDPLNPVARGIETLTSIGGGAIAQATAPKPPPLDLRPYDTPPTFKGGAMGGIDAKTKLTVDENGMPINLKATEEMNATLAQAKKNAITPLEEGMDEAYANATPRQPTVESIGDTSPTIKSSLGEFPRESTLSEAKTKVDSLMAERKSAFIETVQNKFFDKIFDKINTLVKDVKIEFTDQVKYADYNPETHVIRINPNEYVNPFFMKRSLVHEGIHALLYREQVLNPNGKIAASIDYLFRKTERFFEDPINAANYQGIHPDYPQGHYGLKNAGEFIAEISREDFQRALANIPLSRQEQRTFYQMLHGKAMPIHLQLKNAFDAWVETVLVTLGRPPSERTILKAALEVVNKAAESPGIYKGNETLANKAVAEGRILPRVYSTGTDFIANQKQKKATKDIASSGGSGLSTSAFRLRLKKIPPDQRNLDSLKYIDGAHEALKTKEMEQHSRSVDIKRATSLLRTRKALKEIPHVLREGLKFEDDKFTWFNGKDFWPDDTYLRYKGFDDTQIQVYRTVAKLEDSIWDLMTKVAGISGAKLPPRIPGHISHIWTGGYKIKMKDSQGLSHVFSFTTGTEATQALKYLREQAKLHNLTFENQTTRTHWRWSPEIWVPELNKVNLGGVLEGLEISRLNSKAYAKNEVWRKIIENMERRQREGTISEMFERLPRPIRGHDLDTFLNNPSLKKATNPELVENILGRWEAANRLLSKVEWVNEWYLPTLKSGYLDNTPNARKMLDQMAEHFTGTRKNHFQAIDNFFRRTANLFGWDPDAFKLASGRAMEVTALALLLKPSFIYASLVQPKRIVPRLDMAKADLVELGMPLNASGISPTAVAVTSPLRHPKLWEFIKALNSENLTGVGAFMKKVPITDPVFKKAYESGIISPAMMDVIGKKINFLMTPLSMAESAARLQTYVIAFDFFKKAGMGDEEAYRRAADITNEVMVPYDRRVGAPYAFDEWGSGGRLGFAFMTFLSNEVNHHWDMIKAIGKYKNPKAKALAAKALTESLVIDAFVSGITGLPLVAAYDALVFSYNSLMAGLMNDKANLLEDSRTIAIKATKDFGEFYQEVAAFGLAPKAIEAVSGISPSVTTATGGFGIPGVVPTLDVAMWAGKGSVYAIHDLFSDPTNQVTDKQWRTLAQSLPTHLRHPAEYALKHKSIKDAYTDFMDTSNVDWSQDKTNQNFYLRTPEDQKSILWFSAKSTKEMVADAKYRDVTSKNAAVDKIVNTNLDRLFESFKKGNLTPKQQTAILERIIEMTGKSPELDQMIASRFISAQLSGEQRLLLESLTPEKYKNFMEMYGRK